MKSALNTVEEYLATLPEDRSKALQELRKLARNFLGKEIKEEMSYGIIGWVVPHRVFPAGYHCNPKLPLPFVSVASQKAGISLYHMGLYADKQLMDWFVKEYPKHSAAKLDMGKSCIRFKKPDEIPYTLIGELFKKMNAKQWIDVYTRELQKK
ncbi:MAG: DUF1801 domain-containing protein [Bacteroidota bacterium]|jgi:uncharacterized protein YdhG (YjbR/CyaY superfamily)|nr:DUF1801 domain-containing protein [Sphingobacteriales bacterium]